MSHMFVDCVDRCGRMFFLLMFFFVFLFRDRVSCNSGQPQIHYVAKACLKLLVFLDLPPECWHYRDVPSPWFLIFFSSKYWKSSKLASSSKYLCPANKSNRTGVELGRLVRMYLKEEPFLVLASA